MNDTFENDTFELLGTWFGPSAAGMSGAWRAVFISLYAVLIAAALTGNAATILLIATRRPLHNVTNTLIAALAVSDVLKCTLNYPIELHYELNGPAWTLGEDLCYVIQPVFGATVCSSSLIMLLIAALRYRLVCCPYAKPVSLRCALLLAVLTFVLAFALSSPLIAFTFYDKHSINLWPSALSIEMYFCVERWPSDQTRLTYTMLMLGLQFWLPLIVTGILYWKIYAYLRRRRVQRPLVRRSERAICILVTIVAVYFVCWLPISVFSTLNDLFVNSITASAMRLRIPHFARTAPQTALSLKAFALASTSFNPLLYGWLNKSMREEMAVLARRTSVFLQQRMPSLGSLRASGRRGSTPGASSAAAPVLPHRQSIVNWMSLQS